MSIVYQYKKKLRPLLSQLRHIHGLISDENKTILFPLDLFIA